MRKVKTRIKTDRFHGDGREGGSLLYVIFFITLLSVFACGFMAVSRYHIKMALKNRAYMEARLTTHMIHNSFCEAVSKGESDALRLLWNQYEGDLEDEEAEENENEDIPETEGAGADGITKLDADEIQDTNERQDADERQDTDLDLEDREYITEGTGSYTDEKGEPCEVRIRLKLEPVEEKAYVDTWTKISGFSMHLEGEVKMSTLNSTFFHVFIVLPFCTIRSLFYCIFSLLGSAIVRLPLLPASHAPYFRSYASCFTSSSNSSPAE